MKTHMWAAALIAVMVLTVPAADGHWTGRLYDIGQQKEVGLVEALAQLKPPSIILVGEQHSRQSHHDAQLAVIRSLVEAGLSVAVGLEMFRHDSQGALDKWSQGKISEQDFEPIYYDNWNYPWRAYRDIFLYAREQQLPMVGLNVAREVTRQVAYHGFDSLTPSQKGKLPEDVACRVDKEYMAFVRKAFGAHGHGNLNFEFFCEAQLVWDKVMAIHALEYLKTDPERVLVILTGSGHAWKKGIPEQIRQRSQKAVVVLLPNVQGSLDPERITKQEADYLMMGL